MRSLDGAVPVLREMSMTTGSRRAATPTLFMNAERKAEVSMITRTSRNSPRPATRTTCSPSNPATPVRVRPPLRMNMAQTVMTAGLLNPDRASRGVTRPLIARPASTSSATRSMRIHPPIKRMRQTSRIAKTSAI